MKTAESPFEAKGDISAVELQAGGHSGSPPKMPRQSEPFSVIDQRSKMQKLDASGNPISNSWYLGSKVSIAYPYNFTLFRGVINLILATTAYNNQIYIKNSALIENE